MQPQPQNWTNASLWRAYKLVTLSVFGLGLLMLLLPVKDSHAAPPQRCLSSLDCPKKAPCINRRCFRGLKITLTKHVKSSYRIAVAPIVMTGIKAKKTLRLGKRIDNQINRNFNRLLGTFKILPRRIFLEQPPRNGIELGTFQFNPWRKIGANGLIKMALRPGKNGRLVLQFRFYDVDGGQLSLRINQPIESRYYRWHIHQLCDKVYKYLTGQKGIFATKIAYVKRNPRGGKDIWVVDFDGTNKKRVVSNGHLNLMPSWSPNGRYLLFTSYMDGRPNLYKVEVATGRVHRLSQRKGTYTGATFSPNNKKIAFSWASARSEGSSDIYVMTNRGTKMRRLTKAWGIDTSPTWSPDGKMLAFVSERFAHPHIFLMGANGGNQTRLTYKGDYNQEPRWSPRHNEILFTARDERLQYDLFVITVDRNASGEIEPKYRRLTQGQGTNLEATWSPDGRFIMFISTRYGERKMFLMSADGRHQRMFLRGFGHFETPTWSPLLPHPRVMATGKRLPKRVKLAAKTKKATAKVKRKTAKPKPAKRKTVAKKSSKPAARKSAKSDENEDEDDDDKEEKNDKGTKKEKDDDENEEDDD